MDSATLNALSLALGLGLLIGLQRERSGARLGGIRTFPLFALFGAVCGLVGKETGAAIPTVGLAAVAALIALASYERRNEAREAGGQTSEAAALLTYALGLLLALGHYGAAFVVGGVTAVLLQFKEPMHEFAGRMSEADVRAVMRFVIVTLIILPLLPDASYGPYSVLNPREIWLMVVLIVGIGLTGYVCYKLFAGKTGSLINGVLGGLISSTATTVAYARRARGAGTAVAPAAVVIVIAWTISVARVITEVAVVAPSLVREVVPPLAVMLLAMVAGCLALWSGARAGADELPAQHNPAELTGALIFGALYGAVIFATTAVRDHFGHLGVYGVAVISGVVDVDAITLSTARLGVGGTLEPGTVWRVILAATASNVVFKSCALLALGSRALFVRALPVWGGAVAAAAALLLLWP